MQKKQVVFTISIEGEGLDVLRTRINQATTLQWFVTANPEILLCARNHERYAEAVKRATVRTVDGFGLWLMLRLRGIKTTRVTGVELAESVLDQSVQKRWRVALIGGLPDVAERARVELQKHFPALQIHQEQGGTVNNEGEDDEAGAEARHRLSMFDPHVLFVALGHPKQELWIERYANQFPSLRVVIGVGGTFDFWAKVVRRAPAWMRSVGLEWLWRLMMEPKRFLRIWNALVIFPIYFLIDSF